MNTNTLSHDKIIDSNKLFWGNPQLSHIISEEEMKRLCDVELFDWLSSLYWGEGVAMNYALKMSEVSPNKEKWLEVYKDEHRHQTILSNWFIEKGLTPSPRNKLINFAFNQVERIDTAMTESRLVEVMYSTQIFFEELFHSLLRIRLKHINDRDLKAILYQIYTDEADHLGKARTEITEMAQKPKRLYEILEENKSRLFPLDIAKNILPHKKIEEVISVRDSIVSEVLCVARTQETVYIPIKILHQFQKIPGYNCVACSPRRHDGLHLEPCLNTELSLVEDTYIFPKRCEGFNSVVHGGYIGMVLDEMMCYSPILSLNLLPVTRSMSVTFRQPVIVGETYRLESFITKEEGQLISCKAFIKDQSGTICAESEGKLYVPTKIQAPKILGKLAHHEAVHEMFL